MNHEIENRVANAHNRIKTARETCDRFVEHLKSHTDPGGVPGRVFIENGIISVDCFGQVISAAPRTVADGDSGFAIEYVFCSSESEESEEVWRFYLTSGGRLVYSLEQKDHICDFDNRFVAKYICLQVLNNALDSSVFRPCKYTDD